MTFLLTLLSLLFPRLRREVKTIHITGVEPSRLGKAHHENRQFGGKD